MGYILQADHLLWFSTIETHSTEVYTTGVQTTEVQSTAVQPTRLQSTEMQTLEITAGITSNVTEMFSTEIPQGKDTKSYYMSFFNAC